MSLGLAWAREGEGERNRSRRLAGDEGGEWLIAMEDGVQETWLGIGESRDYPGTMEPLRQAPRSPGLQEEQG